jgi:hypothetical protein
MKVRGVSGKITMEWLELGGGLSFARSNEMFCLGTIAGVSVDR